MRRTIEQSAPASFFQRLGAYLLDKILCLLIVIPVWIGRIRDRIYTARVNRAEKKRLLASKESDDPDEASHSNRERKRKKV